METYEVDGTDAIHDLCEKLQDEIGPTPIVRVEDFENWAETRLIKNLLTVSPTTLEQVQSVVIGAKKLNIKIRCVGVGHSWGPLFPDENNLLVRVSEFTRHDGKRMEIVRGSEWNFVTLSSGVTVKELENFELRKRVNLLCNIILTEPTYGGSISAGCHGTGWDCTALPDYVVKMRIVDSDGILRTFQEANQENPNDPDASPGLFKAVQTNLGLFGIIYDMTFRIPSKIIVKAENDFTITADVFYKPENLKALVLGNESIEIFWWPFSSLHKALDTSKPVLLPRKTKLSNYDWDPKQDQLWVKKVNKENPGEGEKIKGPLYYVYLRFKDWLESVATNAISTELVKVPWLTPFFCKASFEYLKISTPTKIFQQLPHAIHYRSHIPNIKVHDMEVCFRIQSEDFCVIAKACQDVIKIVYDDAKIGDYALNVAMEMRFMADSKSYLCPAYIGAEESGGTGHTCYLEVLSFAKTQGWKEFCDKVFQKWKVYSPTVHWAKEWELLDGGVEYMKERYAAPGQKFVEQLNKAKADPDGMFRNSTLNTILF